VNSDHDNEQGDQPGPEAGVKEDVREAVAGAEDVQSEVERITTEALSRGHVDTEGLRRIITEVAHGIDAGVAGKPDHARKTASEAVEGLQSALIGAADSARLAAEEAASRLGSSYSEGDVRRSLEDLKQLESLMLDTLSRAAKAGTNTGAAILDDLVEHARRSGTRLGEQVDGSLRSLATALPEALREVALAGLGAARETSARAAQVASGILSGTARALGENQKQDSKKDDDRGNAD